MSCDSSELSDTDAVLVGRDDVSNYNPEQILPESPETISKIRLWLQPTSYNVDTGEYRKHLVSCAPGTGVWLTSSSPYQERLNSQEHGTLWIKGIPGSGKSVFASKLIDELSREQPGAPVLYFFFRRIIDANHEPVALLRDWLDQVLAYSPPLQKQLSTYLKSRRSLDSLSIDDLWKELRLALAGLPENVYCVADALDEMDSGHDGFLRSLAALGQWKPDKVKLIITSRPVPSVEGPLRSAKAVQIRLDENLVDVDISTYVRQGLERSTIVPSDRALITEAIPGRANGLFLYAKLAMDAFLEPGAITTDVLQRLPTDLNDMYTNLLQEHAARSGVPEDIQRLILQSATHATRPLRLLELAEMISVTYPAEIARDLKSTKDLVRVACGPLLELLADETVCVVHHSFTEYLKGSTRSNSSGGYPVLGPGATHERLALACLTYLQAGCLDRSKLNKSGSEGHELDDYDSDDMDYHDKRVDSQATREEVQLRLKHPFLDYAVANWEVHAIKSSEAMYNQDNVNMAISSFLGNTQRRTSWVKLKWPGSEDATKGVTQLHIAARAGLEAYVKEILRADGIDVNACDSRGKTPLWWAAASGHGGVVRLLVDAGANPDQEDAVYGLKPLHEAAKRNHAQAVKALLEAGVDPLTAKTKENPGNWCGNAPRSRGHTALMYACESGHLEAVEAFIPLLKNIETVHRALAWAAGAGRSSIVKRILQHAGVDANAKVRGDTPLFLACGIRDVGTVQALLEAGADPNISCLCNSEEFAGIGGWRPMRAHRSDSDRRFTPWLRFCGTRGRRYYRHDRVEDDLSTLCSILIEAGANVHQRSPSGSTALHGAVDDTELARLLLDAGVDPNAADDHGATPVHLVRKASSLCLLVEHGRADINKQQNDGRTPLLCLLDTYHTESILKLLEYSPDCTVTDSKGDSALHIAFRRSSPSPAIIEGLLDAGADPNLKNRSGEAPLHVLDCASGDAGKILDLMLKAGADLSAPDYHGATLLFRTLRRSYTSGKNPHRDLKALIDRGSSINLRDYQGRTLLHEAIKHYDTSPATTGSNGMDAKDTRFSFLLGLGLDLSVVDYRGNNLLHELAMRPVNHESYDSESCVAVWEHLISLGLDPSQGNHYGRTPLHILCSKRKSSGTYAISTRLPVDVLISALTASVASNIDVPDHDGITPLHLAVTTSDFYTKKLLEAGADVTGATHDGLAPLHLATRARESNIVGMLLDTLLEREQGTYQSSADMSRMDRRHNHRGAWSHAQQQVIQTAINAQAKNKWTPLSYACKSGSPETVALLLRAGADTTLGRIARAFAEFEDEQTLWDQRPHKGDVEMNLDAGGLTIADLSRPAGGRASPQHSYSNRSSPAKHTPRIEEILELLIANDANVSDMGSDPSHSVGRDAISTAIANCSDYTAACLTQIRDRHYKQANNPARKKTIQMFTEHSYKRLHQCSLRSLQEFGIVEQGDANQQLFQSMMARREYYLVEELFHLGTDFLKSASKNDSNFAFLVENGYSQLAKKIGRLLLDTRSEDDCHQKGQACSPALADIEGGRRMLVPRDESEIAFLLLAIRRNLPNMDMVRLLVEEFGADVNELWPSRRHVDGDYKVVPTDSPLLSAALGSYWWHAALAVPYLIEHSADLNIRNYKGQTPLHIALGGPGSYPGLFHKDIARSLINADADVNAVDIEGKCCLSYAGDDVGMIRLLITRGAIVKADALFAAINSKQVDILEALLSAGANPNMRREPVPRRKIRSGRGRHSIWEQDDIEKHELYPVHFAATETGGSFRDPPEKKKARKQMAARIVETLLAHGADPFATFLLRSTENAKAGRYDSEAESESDTDNEDEDNEHLLLATSSRDELTSETPKTTPSVPHIPKGYEQATILHDLIVEGEIIQPFLDLPSLDLEHRDAKGHTLLHATCCSSEGPDVSAGILPVGGGKPEEPSAPSIFHLLLARGADPRARDNTGRNALHLMLWMSYRGHSRRPTFKSSLTHLATTYPDLVNQQDVTGRTPLHCALAHAVATRDISAAETMLAAGADPLLAENNGDTCLHTLAQRLDSPELRSLFQKLLGLGCSSQINTPNARGETPLFAFYLPANDPARIRHHQPARDEADGPALELLSAAGADFATRDSKGCGLLHVAARGGVRRFEWLMREKGLDPLLEDGGRQTAVDVAAAVGNAGVLGLFERK